MAKPTVTAQRLRYLFNYDPATGNFTRRVRVSRNTKVGDMAGTKSPDGYLHIRVDCCLYLSHRLAWIYVTGEQPKFQIDHIDGNRCNNAFSNLRDVYCGINSQNQRSARADNKSGFLGVAKNGSGWGASIKAGGMKHHLGTFKNPELAHAAYLEAKRRLHPGCTI